MVVGWLYAAQRLQLAMWHLDAHRPHHCCVDGGVLILHPPTHLPPATPHHTQDMAQRQQWGHVINICCVEQGSGMHAVTKQAMEALNQELR